MLAVCGWILGLVSVVSHVGLFVVAVGGLVACSFVGFCLLFDCMLVVDLLRLAFVVRLLLVFVCGL